MEQIQIQDYIFSRAYAIMCIALQMLHGMFRIIPGFPAMLFESLPLYYRTHVHLFLILFI